MLTLLSISDFAVARSIELEFGPGLTVISGETGAGKSLLVGALGFLSGERADTGTVRHGAQRAELSAQFDLADAPAARAWLVREDMLDRSTLDRSTLDRSTLDRSTLDRSMLDKSMLDESGLDDSTSDDSMLDKSMLDDSTLSESKPEESCLLRRTLRADGGSRAWINGRPVTLAQLATLAGHLVEIHGQHAHQALLAKSAQLALLDDFGDHAQALAAVRDTAAAWSALHRERERLQQLGDVSERITLLEYQVAELESEALEPESIAELLSAHRRQAHASTLLAACAAACEQLTVDADPAISRQLQQIRTVLGKVAEHEPRLSEVDGLLEAAAIQLEEAGSLLARIQDDLDLDPARYQALDQRLTRIHELARKHRLAPEALAGQRQALIRELDTLRDTDTRLAALDDDIATADAHWREAARILSDARRSAAQRLSQRVSELINELGMGRGRFEIALEPLASEQPNATGAERVEFLFSANAGQPARPLRKVASGGELSRLSLAIEVAALGHDLVPTMVFDEVDAGIGGAVAEIVGQKLRALGTRRQALCITHLAQVAAQGNTHYRVSKSQAGGITQSAVEHLDRDARIEELARMLGGVEISQEARAAAQRLIINAARQ